MASKFKAAARAVSEEQRRDEQAGAGGAKNGGDGVDGSAKSAPPRLNSFGDVVTTTMAAQKWGKKKQRKINKLHAQFETTVGIMLGLRHAESLAVDGAAVDGDGALTDDDFEAFEKRKFPRSGSATTPEHELSSDFEFKVYAGKLFAQLRARDGISSEAFLSSLASNLPYLDLVTNSKSGEWFHFSGDKAYLVKSMPQSESKFLRRFLQLYWEHVVEYPHTMLCRIYGMYRIRFDGKPKQHFIVMGNLFPDDRQVHEKYDLKGSTVGRAASEAEKRLLSPVLKDLDFMDKKIFVGPRREQFIMQLKADARFLRELGIMDYSLLVGVHYRDRRDEAVSGYSHADQYVPSGDLNDLDDRILNFARRLSDAMAPMSAESQAKAMAALEAHKARQTADGADEEEEEDEEEDDGLVARQRPQPQPFSQWLEEHGGVYHGQSPEGGEVTYYVGIIDILQDYGLKKKAEHFFKSFKYDGDKISAVSARKYAERFVKFISERLE